MPSSVATAVNASFAAFDALSSLSPSAASAAATSSLASCHEFIALSMFSTGRLPIADWNPHSTWRKSPVSLKRAMPMIGLVKIFSTHDGVPMPPGSRFVNQASALRKSFFSDSGSCATGVRWYLRSLFSSFCSSSSPPPKPADEMSEPAMNRCDMLTPERTIARVRSIESSSAERSVVSGSAETGWPVRRSSRPPGRFVRSDMIVDRTASGACAPSMLIAKFEPNRRNSVGHRRNSVPRVFAPGPPLPMTPSVALRHIRTIMLSCRPRAYSTRR